MANKPALIALGIGALGLLLLIELRPWQDLSKDTGGNETAVPGTQPAEKPPGAVAAVTPEPALEVQAIRAQLSPVTYTKIAAELGAKVQTVARREGELFAKGDTLVVFDCDGQRAQHQRSLAAMEIAQRNYETNKKLLDLGAVGRVEFDNSFSELQKSKAEVSELSSVLRRCTISAPFPGRVVEQHVRSQQFVQAGQPVLDILDNRALELEFIVPSMWSSWLVQGYKFLIAIDETSKSYPAQVTRVGARIDSVSQTFKVAAVISGNFKELSPGMSGTLEIEPPALTN
jgi:membrane fusion protein, multidrug efflux system